MPLRHPPQRESGTLDEALLLACIMHAHMSGSGVGGGCGGLCGGCRQKQLAAEADGGVASRRVSAGEAHVHALQPQVHWPSSTTRG